MCRESTPISNKEETINALAVQEENINGAVASKFWERNRVPFATETEAQAAGYRKSRNCK